MSTNPTPTVSQPLTTVEENTVSAITALAGVAVGLGAFGHPTQQIIVSVAGIVGAAVLKIANQFHRKTLATAGLLSR